jgi:PKHD-type hydroxylase
MILDLSLSQNVDTEKFTYWDNFLTDAQLDKILNEFDQNTPDQGLIGYRSDISYNHNVRSNKVCWLDRNINTEDIWQTLHSAITEVNEKYFCYDLRGCFELAQLGVYSSDTRDHYTWHVDSAPSGKYVRKLSMSILLNKPYEFEGGELQIKIVSDQPIILEQKRGRAWFFPSNTLHRVTPIISGIRKSLVLWIAGPPFR